MFIEERHMTMLKCKEFDTLTIYRQTWEAVVKTFSGLQSKLIGITDNCYNSEFHMREEKQKNLNINIEFINIFANVLDIKIFHQIISLLLKIYFLSESQCLEEYK